MQFRCFLPALILAAAPGGAPAFGDLFELNGGGEIAGEAGAGAGDKDDYVIQAVPGAEITVDRSQLQRITDYERDFAEYVRRSRALPDTAQSHREMARWCREKKLPDQADQHLKRLLELDPADADARRSLGFQQQGAQWLTRDQLMAERGLELYDGKYRTRQDIALRERQKEASGVEVDWFAKIRTWRNWLDNRRPERVAEAETQLAAIVDPSAAPALVKLLEAEEDDWVFKLLLAALGRLDHPVAIQTLVAYSLDDPELEIREQCLDYLTNASRMVSVMPYIKALKSKDNVVVNRAAEALGKIGDPAAVSPLIDALVTTHKYQTQPGQPGQIGASFSPTGGGGGLNMGGNGPVIIKRDHENLKVWRALVKLSGNQDFEYDEQAWRRWYVSKQMRQQFNSRRDE